MMEIIVQNFNKKLKIKSSQDLQNILNLAADFITKKYRVNPTHSLIFNFVSSRKIAQINKEFLNHQGTTDVITFDYRLDDYSQEINDLEIGEIFICPEVAKKYSQTFDNSFENELILYCIHGLLHLYGFDDITTAKAKKMRIAEKETMNFLSETNGINLNNIFTLTITQENYTNE